MRHPRLRDLRPGGESRGVVTGIRITAAIRWPSMTPLVDIAGRALRWTAERQRTAVTPTAGSWSDAAADARRLRSIPLR